MKNDFLTIPIASNYEVNSALVVRNKKTGHILKEHGSCFTLYAGKRKISRSGKSLRQLALSAVEYKGSDISPRWVAVPSLNYRYELCCTGILRNARTKRCLKLQRRNNYLRYTIHFGKRTVDISLKSLMWEVFGVIAEVGKRAPIPTTICRAGRILHFGTLKATAKFIAKIRHRSSDYVRRLLVKRVEEFDGWAITYHEPKFGS